MKELLTKAMFSISGTAFLLLLASARVSALVSCMIAGTLFFLFLIKAFSGNVGNCLKDSRCCLSGAVVSIIFLGHFLDTWENSQLLGDFFGVNTKWVLLICALMLAVAAIPFTALIVYNFANDLSEDDTGGKRGDVQSKVVCSLKSVQKSFLVICVVYTMAISAILRANFSYIDDMGRIAKGYRGWDNFSRILSNIFSVFIHAGTYLTDVSPLPQMIAVVIMAASGVLLLRIIYDRSEFSVCELAALVLFGLNPYFLECLSYKYDAPYMALSVMGSIVPLYFRRKKGYTYVCMSIIGSLVVCTTYQAATGIFPMLVIALALRMWNEKEETKSIVEFCAYSAIGYAVGLILFRTIIMIPVDNYVSTSLPEWKLLLPVFLKNLGEYFSYVKGDFKTVWLFLILALGIGYIWENVKTSRRKKGPAFVMTLFSVALMLLVCFGIYPAMVEPLFKPRAMYGFGIFVSLMGIIAAEGKSGVPFRLSVLILSWMFFTFAFTYGNALYVQKEYTDFRTKEVIQDLDDMEAFLSGEAVTVQISGTIGQAPALRNMPQNYEMLNRLIPITFKGLWDWGTYDFYHYYNFPNMKKDTSIDLTTCDLPVLKDTVYHTIKGEGPYILVELK